jgi:hypothetical protein
MQIPLDFSVGVNEDKTLNIAISEVYPNPMHGTSKVAIELSEEMNVSYSITTMTGQVIRAKDLGKVKPGHRLIDVESNSLSKGIYFLSFDVDGTRHTQKVIVQ